MFASAFPAARLAFAAASLAVAAAPRSEAAAGPAPIEIAVAVSCPGRAAVARALDAALVNLPPQGRQSARIELTAAAATASPRPQAATALRLRVEDATGAPVIERLISVERDGCTAAARAIALVVERHERAVAWSSGAPILRPARPALAAASPPAPAPDSKLESPPLGLAQRGEPAEHLAEASDPGAAPRLLLLVGPLISSRGAGRPSAGIELRARITGPLAAGVGLLLPSTIDEALPGGGHAQLDLLPLIVRALGERPQGRLSWLYGLDGVFSFERGQTSAIAVPDQGRRLVLAAGGSLGLAWWLTPRLRLGFEASVARVLVQREFDVAGHGPVLQPPPWQAQLAMRLGWTVWP